MKGPTRYHGDGMLDSISTHARWIPAGLALLLLGLFCLFGLGRKRGTHLYRTRLALWAMAVALIGTSLGAMTPGATPPAQAELASPVFDQESGAVDAVADQAEQEDYLVSCYCTVAPPDRW